MENYDEWLHEFLDELVRLGYHNDPSFVQAKEYFDNGADATVAAQEYFEMKTEA